MNVTLDKTHKIKALVDSGSTICLADSSILNHIANKSTKGPPISVTNCHNNREKTRGCYKATIDVDEDLPYPMKDKQINIHVTNNLSSELILGTDFLKENGAVINLRDNSVTFLPEGMAALAGCNKPIIREAVTAFGEGVTSNENLTHTHRNTYMLQPTETKILGHMDQITFHARIITDTSLIFRPGTTVMITSNLSPAPYVPDGLYSVRDNNTVQITIRNTDVRPIKLLKGKPITGITVHLLDEEYYEEIPISKDTLRTYFLANEVLTNEHNTPQQGTTPEVKEYTPKQHLEHIAKSLRHATSLLEESGLDPPGIRAVSYTHLTLPTKA